MVVVVEWPMQLFELGHRMRTTDDGHVMAANTTMMDVVASKTTMDDDVNATVASTKTMVHCDRDDCGCDRGWSYGLEHVRDVEHRMMAKSKPEHRTKKMVELVGHRMM